ncbi:hypothetical protein RND81_13G125000 [Saponaria officinalis]|uniref:Uncharacterized protein n=1 Tax=Saponaria officinalis TaxID=3572 RepID=A0AAW1H1Q7_SAPOF
MLRNLGKWFLRVLLLVNVVVVDVSPAKEKAACVYSGVFNFGDSNSDTGGLSAAFSPLPWPYGETFFEKAYGRYSNGRLIMDFIAEKLGMPYLSAYLNSLGANYSHGTNFATGGSTIRQPNETIFATSISPFSLDIQIAQYDQLKSRSKDLFESDPKIRNMLPKEELFSKALYTFDIGQNDLAVAIRTINNDDQIRAEIPKIIAQLSSAVQHLYKEGGRSFWIHNTGPIGCLPDSTGSITSQPGTLDKYGCIKSRNNIAKEFNKQLNDTVSKLRTELPKAAITYVDVYTAKYGLISQATSLGN